MENTKFTIGNYCNGRKNNLDFIRFLAASLVIYSHSFVLVQGNYNGELLVRYTKNNWSSGSLAVSTFLIISGFLVLQSYDRSNNVFSYFKKRILRIFPGLAVVTLLSVFILGPLLSTLSTKEYFQNSATYDYLKNIFLIPVYGLPGVFSNMANASINGSLWTIGYEFFFYILIAVMGIIGVFKFKWSQLYIFIAFIYIYIFKANIFMQSFTVFKILDIYTLIELGLSFSIGMLIYTYRNKIILDKWLALLALICLLLFWRQGVCVLPFIFFGSYLIFYIGYNQKIKVYNFTKYGDFSYGIYIYAFPIQQTYIYLLNGSITPYMNFILSFVTTLFFAALSWHLIEKPFLKLKSIKIFKRGNKSD